MSGRREAVPGAGPGERRRDTADAEDRHRRAAEAEVPAAMRDLAEALSSRGEYDEAEQYYRGAIHGGDVMALVGLASMLRRREGRDDADEAAAILAATEEAEVSGAFGSGGQVFAYADIAER